MPSLPVKRTRVFVWVAVASCVPYIVVKSLWLSGGLIGATNAAGAAEMTDVRFVVGNSVTILLEGCAVALAFALTYPWGQRLPACIVLLPIWVATGLLAPIVLGVPAGLVVQGLAGGSAIPRGQGLSGWIFAVVYSGFTVLGVCLAALFTGYARDRWPEIVTATPTAPRSPFAVGCSAVTACYALALIAWSIGGTSWGGPAGFDTAAQRTTLAVTGLLIAVGVAAAIRPVRPGHTVVALWVGTSVSVLSGPTHVLLSNKGHPPVPLLVSALVAAAAGLAVTRESLRDWSGRRRANGSPNGSLGPSAIRSVEAETAG